jgi:hypothetical protein
MVFKVGLLIFVDEANGNRYDDESGLKPIGRLVWQDVALYVEKDRSLVGSIPERGNPRRKAG